jgi:hypothetical protein
MKKKLVDNGAALESFSAIDMFERLNIVDWNIRTGLGSRSCHV